MYNTVLGWVEGFFWGGGGGSGSSLLDQCTTFLFQFENKDSTSVPGHVWPLRYEFMYFFVFVTDLIQWQNLPSNCRYILIVFFINKYVLSSCLKT